MKNTKVIICGAGKQAEFTHYLFSNDSPYEVVAFSVQEKYISNKNPTLQGLPIISLEELLANYSTLDYKIHIAIGRNDTREYIFNVVKSRGFSFVNYVCSKADVWNDLELGENVFIDQASSIHPFVSVGNNTILIGARVGHHSTIGRNILISGAILGGSVTVGDNSFLGLSSSIKENVIIGCNNIIGVGTYIGHNTKNDSIFCNHCTRIRDTSSHKINVFR